MSEIRVHPSAVVGSRVSIGAGAVIGPNCVLDGASRIGERTILDGNVTLLGDVEVGPDCRIESGVTTTPPGTGAGDKLTIGHNTLVGAGALLGLGLRIGPRAAIEPGSVVARDVPARGVVQGNPAVVVDFGAKPRSASSYFGADLKATDSVFADCGVGGVRVHRFPCIVDPRGTLSFGEFGRSVPFMPERYFLVYDVKAGELRGEHAHATCQELLVALNGSIAVAFDDGERVGEVVLDSPNYALYVPPRVWATQYKHSPGAVLAVLASHYYDGKDYIRNYEEFLTIAGRPI